MIVNVFLIALWAFATLWIVVLIHEAGHCLVGLMGGVPLKAMAIRLKRPPHVALRDDDWRSPDDSEYVGVSSATHPPGLRHGC